MIIDFHTHILPDIDDGSQNVEESIDMLEMLCIQNVQHVVATPHFYPNQTGLSDFLERRDVAYNSLLSNNLPLLPRISLGAEVAFFRGIGKTESIEQLCIDGTRLLLIEMPFSQWGQNEEIEINQILGEGIIPVIAHIERYYPFQKTLTTFNSIINLPIYLQVNSESLLHRKTRKFIFELMDNLFPVLLGTDCHNTTKRKPNMETGRKILKHKYGEDSLRRIDELGLSLLKNNDASRRDTNDN